MFEKSLVGLIKGLRNHKGNEKEFLQNSLKECRAEIRSQDMDLKATALLKLIYLEMFGQDMSWASFHVLEVMSSPKYHLKRIGYLGAVQSFRSDTEVLMLATNQLKKDLTSTSLTTMTLPIIALPHLATPSLALSVLSDLLPRLSHSNSAIRKKTIVTLYRLALVYPETLRAAWPKIKERLMNPDEDPSVTAAIVNVICELGWRRPKDFLPLAPRLFELLVDSGNNWMAIKLIKLFATLTPLEPRLVRKLLPRLTEIIKTTPAMSLLYEGINGIIQGGILGSADDISGREEIATLCVNKLRGMIMVNGDPNLKYVALLAFNQIVVTHPFLVAEQEDVILDCIDSPDITIRIKALDLVQGMVSSDNLVSIVGRLMRQLKAASASSNAIEEAPADAEDDDDMEARIKAAPKGENRAPPLPEDYRIDAIGRILTMCSQNNYSNLIDFDWYIDVLTQLVRVAPAQRLQDGDNDSRGGQAAADISERIGDELRNVAVKVKAIRPSAVQAAELNVGQLGLESPAAQPIVSMSLKPMAWILGEYASLLSSPSDTMGYLLQLLPRTSSPEVLTVCLQAITKVFSAISGDAGEDWSALRKSRTCLLMARIIHAVEPFTVHPNLEVQERAVEFTELLRLTAEAANAQPASTADVQQDAPLLLTQAIPSLFAGWDLNSVAPGAQANVPLPDGLDLDAPIHPDLPALLAQADTLAIGGGGGGGGAGGEMDRFDVFYHQRPSAEAIAGGNTLEPAIARIGDAPSPSEPSYQDSSAATDESYLDADIIARRRAERAERYRDDPFYIGGAGSGSQQASRGATPRSLTPIHNILRSSNGPDLDIDAIPIMELDLRGLNADGGPSSASSSSKGPKRTAPKPHQQLSRRAVVAADETLASGRSTPRDNNNNNSNYESETNSDGKSGSTTRAATAARKLKQQSLLQVDSSSLGSLLSLEGGGGGGDGGGGMRSAYDYEAQRRQEEEMARAVREVERLRLEMQRANERIAVAQGVDALGTVVKAKAKKKKKDVAGKPRAGDEAGPAADGDGDGGMAAAGGGGADAREPGEEDPAAAVVVAKPKKKKKKAAVPATDEEGGSEAVAAAAVVAAKPKKKKKTARTAEIEEAV